MRDRLIELLDNYGDDLSLCDVCKRPSEDCEGCKNEQLAEYLFSNGVIVPPCKVGDTVYAFCGDFGVVLPYFVENLRIGFMDKNRNYWTYEANCHSEETDELLDEIDFDLDDLGKTVFLTKEEAEQVLKGE